MDEAQIEVIKSLVKFKLFDTEEEANSYKEIDKLWSDVGHAKNDKYFRAYSVVGEVAANSVKDAGEYFKLNVSLSSGYSLGRNWKECH